MRNLLFLRTVVALAVFYVGVIIGCGGGNSGSGYTPPPPTTYTATLTAGTGITSVIPYQLSGAAGATSSTTLVVAPGYQNPTASGNCAVTISGTTITVTFGSSNCSSTISATQIPVVNATLSTMVTPGAVFDSDFSTASITIKVVATGSGFSFKAAPTQALSTGYSAIPLEDTGTTANGGEVYSVTFTPGVQFPGLRYYGKSADFLGFIILAVDNSGNTMNNMAMTPRATAVGR